MIDEHERAAMAQTVGAAIADTVAKSGEGADVDAVLAALGWLEMLDSAPDDAVDVVFTALGAANATATVLDDVVASALGESPGPDLAVLLPRFAAWDAPGRLDESGFQAQGIATARVATAARLLVVCAGDAAAQAVTVATANAEVVAVGGVDPAAGLESVRVRGDGSIAVRLDAAAWQSALALGRRAVAHQILGACRTMLDLARTHALERTQFGRPIARFQAVRHKLAEVLVAVEGLEAALTAAREQPTPETAALAKAVAGRAALTTAKHCQQVLAGIGFTTEHRFHLFMKRVALLEGLFGSADAIALDIGRRLLATRQVPTLVEL